MDAIITTAVYYIAAVLILSVSILTYILVTPYKEMQLVAAGNTAAAFALIGAVAGIAVPQVILILHSSGGISSIPELLSWALVAVAMMAAAFVTVNLTFLKDVKTHIEAGNTAVGMSIGTMNLVAGCLLAAVLTP